MLEVGPAGGGYSRMLAASVEDLTGQGRVYQDFAWAGPTPSGYGAPNQQQSFATEPAPVTACPAPPEDTIPIEL